MTLTFGDIIYKDIENDTYLIELYNDILYNYSLSLFGNHKLTPKTININHALRFADILSKSVHSTSAENHKMWAQEIVALLNFLYPDDQNVKYFIGSVLTNSGNYRGLKLHRAEFTGTDILDRSYNEYVRESMKVPADSAHYFFKSQKNAYDNLGGQYFSYSGPTSMGKSFIIRMFIKKQIMDGIQNNFAILVPTKALINEVSSKTIDDLKEMLALHNYRIVTSAGAISLQQNHNFILILTPERLLYLLLQYQNFELNYLFVDEAHKISGKDSRSPFYYKLIDLVVKRGTDTHIVFSSPNIPNPDVYLKLIPKIEPDKVLSLTSTYAPVSQTKYLVDLMTNSIKAYSDLSNTFLDVCSFKRSVDLSELVQLIGRNSQNIIYCSSTSKAVSYALEYAEKYSENYQISPETSALIRDIKSEIHGDYYLAYVLEKGVAYHIGYLPSDFRIRIEDLFKRGEIKTIFCTSTLVEGVNLPADNLFITSYKNGFSNMTPVDFKNLIGRVGRIEYNLYGNVFLVRTEDNTKIEKFEELIQIEVPEQKLSVVSELTRSQKEKIIDSLLAGNIELLRYPKTQSNDNYTLMRRFAIMLLRDVLSSNKTSLIIREFSNFLDSNKIDKIIEAFGVNAQVDDDINISIDQISNLTVEITKGLEYPSFNMQGKIDYDTLVDFLEKLNEIFKWEVYEKSTLGHRSKNTQVLGKLRWYAVILTQWMSGNGLSFIINAAIKYKQDNPTSGVEINGQIIDYDNTKKHKNAVISATLNAIEDVILYRISNYFLRFSLEYKKFHRLEYLKNDWYEYVEYGTTNPLTIFLQKTGFSREASTYIKHHHEDYVIELEDVLKIRETLLLCPSKLVRREAKEVKYNVPELFISNT